MNWLREKLRAWLGITDQQWKAVLFRLDGRMEVFKLVTKDPYYHPDSYLKLPKLQCGYVRSDSIPIEVQEFESHPMSGYSCEEKLVLYIERKPDPAKLPSLKKDETK